MAASPSGVINPFRDSIHANPWTDPRSDVPAIGREVFNLLLAEVDAVRRLQTSRSLLIFGQPGCGKTHLIARARLHLAELCQRRSLNNIFVAVQLHTSPTRIWRHLRYRLVEDLLRVPRTGMSQMEGLLFRLLAAPGSRGGLLDEWKQELLSQAGVQDAADHALANGLFAIVNYLDRSGELQNLPEDMFQHLEGEEFIPPVLRVVLAHLAHRRHLGIAHAWLRGDSLPDAAIQILGSGRPDDDDPENEARDFVLKILRLIGPETPVVFCFDQMEGLQLAPGDIAGFFAFGNAAAALHDLAANVALISFVQSQFVTILRNALGANFDRISEKSTELPGLTLNQGAQLIQARLAGNSYVQAARIRMAEFTDLFSSSGLATPRQIIARAAQIFDKTSEGTLDELIASNWEAFLENAARIANPARADEILEHGLPLLLRMSGKKEKISKGLRDINLTLRGPAGVRFISICNQQNMNSLSARLRRLQSDVVPTSDLVLVRDARMPIGRAAKRTVGYLDELTSKGARLVHPSSEAMVALDALRLLITAAQSGDLAHNGSAIDPNTVEQWLSQHLSPHLSQLTSDLSAGTAPVDSTLREELIDLLGDRLLISLPEASLALKKQESEITACAAANPDLFGYLDGPPPLLFHRTVDGVS